MSGEKVAKDEEILRKNNITEIINCAGDYCEISSTYMFIQLDMSGTCNK